MLDELKEIFTREQTRQEYKKGKCTGCYYNDESKCAKFDRCNLAIRKVYTKENPNVSNN